METHDYPENPAEMAKVVIGEIELAYRARDAGGRHYLQRGHAEEYHSRFYPVLGQALKPGVCVDIGANYGYTALLMRRAFPLSALTLVEPVPWLAGYVRHNFAINRVHFERFESAICSVSDGSRRSRFGVRTNSTQDSRVVPPPGTEEIETDVVTLDELTATVDPATGVYVKIDTQGWEQRVFEGGEGFLSRHDRWFAKTEFAPQWLESQGTDPIGLLKWLMARFDVFESAGRVRWAARRLNDVIGQRLPDGQEAAFVSYVRNLALDDKGWVDLYVLPPSSRRAYDL